MASETAQIGLRRFWRRLALFLAPLVLLVIVVTLAVARTGEILPVRWVASMHDLSRPQLYLPEYSDHLYRYKIDVARRFKSDVLVIGSSRSSQWRSAMFPNTSFYNAGNAMYLPEDYINALNDIGDNTPRVMIVSLDAFMFSEKFAEQIRARSKTDINGLSEARYLLVRVLKRFYAEPAFIFRDNSDPIYGVPALGFYAIKDGLGLRVDGSVQYGDAISRNRPRADPLDAALGINKDGSYWPALPAGRLSEKFKRDFEEFAKAAAARGITIVAVTSGIHPAAVDALNNSRLQGAWREFRSAATRSWIDQLGIVYFDFSDLSSYDGKLDEFVDGFHPSEPAYVRMLIKMSADPRFSKLIPGVNKDALQGILDSASRFEAYRNKF